MFDFPPKLGKSLARLVLLGSLFGPPKIVMYSLFVGSAYLPPSSVAAVVPQSGYEMITLPLVL